MEGPFSLLSDPGPTSLQDEIAARASSEFIGIDHPRRILFTHTDSEAWVSDVIARSCGVWTGQSPLWIRLFRKDESQGFLAVLRARSPEGEADLIVTGHRGMLSRSALRALCGWAFGAAALRRVVARIPTNRPDLQDFARRAGFRHEGLARGYFPDDTDASVWAMHRADCPWLSRSAPAIPTADVSPSSSHRVH